MKPDYKNWMPKGMVLSGIGITALSLNAIILNKNTRECHFWLVDNL